MHKYDVLLMCMSMNEYAYVEITMSTNDDRRKLVYVER